MTIELFVCSGKQSRCGESKPVGAFGSWRSVRDKTCKACRNLADRGRYVPVVGDAPPPKAAGGLSWIQQDCVDRGGVCPGCIHDKVSSLKGGCQVKFGPRVAAILKGMKE